VPRILFASHPDPACGATFRGKHPLRPASGARQRRVATRSYALRATEVARRRRRTHLRQPATVPGHRGPSRGDSEGSRCLSARPLRASPASTSPSPEPPTRLHRRPSDGGDVYAFARGHVPICRHGAQHGFGSAVKIPVHNLRNAPQNAHRLSTNQYTFLATGGSKDMGWTGRPRH
jgi:hypothetical protein